ncbi:MAG: sensor histidine kinase [Flavobacteriales bacterium]|nr:sensor histidine kinase [Flavobacteriales bacterium]MCB9365187.1 sensor histidine kinase [Flavobacteriales bacterium]
MLFFTPNTNELTSFYDRAKFVLAWRISLIFAIVFAILTPLFTFTSLEALLPTSLAFTIAVASLIYMNKTKKYKPLFWIYSISGTLLIHFSINFILNFTHYVDFLWVIATMLISFVGLGRRVGFVFLIIHSILIGYFYFFTLNTHISILSERTFLEIVGDYIEILLALFSIGYILLQYLKMNEYSELELKKTNKQLVEKNNENIVLIKEVHHRVKNNLQIIISLLRLQKNELTEESKIKFDEAINRVMAMSIIHKKLYQTEELSKIDIESYIQDLINEIISSLSTYNNIKTNIKTEIDSIGLKTIVPFGLLMNELLSNSFKHAFTDINNGIINIAISSNSSSDLSLVYSDNGSWKDPSENSSQFGLELIQVLTDQLEGTFNRNESEYTFNLQNLDN